MSLVPEPPKPNQEKLTGNLSQDLPNAFKQVNVVEDFKRLPEIPCARNALMYGIASGSGIGCVRFMSAGPKRAANWAVGTFVFVSSVAWTICRRDRAKENQTMQAIIQQYPERHARVAKERALAAKAAKEGSGTPSS
ncbi:hypothetical protein FRB96_001485 [Tulasnella sp. 330]|nr:hypothetical protein FRB96_001485 [Tulasnella sp. 330]KAG8886644.1 hypothetical protein FRB97_000064 [Tulasnella sp. 331]KAG8890663.1 hypothetical protein FRB98_006166 [Tulasnella sp. 332]